MCNSTIHTGTIEFSSIFEQSKTNDADHKMYKQEQSREYIWGARKQIANIVKLQFYAALALPPMDLIRIQNNDILLHISDTF